MATDWIPANDDAFDALANQFTNEVAGTPADFGLTAVDGTNLTTALYGWTTAYNAEIAARAAAAAAVQTRNTARETMEGLMRVDGARIQANPGVSDASRELAGLPVHKTTKTPAPVPTTAPILQVDTSRRLEHIISWTNAGGTKARPAGVAGLQLFIKVGSPAPAGLEECRLLGMFTRTPALEHFDSADGGKVAYYIGQWVNTRGEPGPMSDVVAATITALM